VIQDLQNTWELVHILCLDGFITGMVLAIVAPWMGTLLVVRRMPFLGLAIPQLAGAGTAVAWLLFPVFFPEALAHAEAHQHPNTMFLLAGSGAAILVGLVGLTIMGRKGRVSSSHAAIVYLIGLAVAEIAWITGPYPEMAESSARRGRLLTVLPESRDLVVGASIAALILVIWLRRQLWLAAFDSDLARLKKLKPSVWLLITLLLLGAHAALTVPVTGPEVLLALLIIPPAVLNRAVPSLASYGPLSSLAGVLGTAAGFHLSFQRDWPLNPSVIVGLVVSSLAVAFGAGLVRILLRIAKA